MGVELNGSQVRPQGAGDQGVDGVPELHHGRLVRDNGRSTKKSGKIIRVGIFLYLVWATAHHTQFAQPGWTYLKHGSGVGYLPGGGTYVTYAAPRSEGEGYTS